MNKLHPANGYACATSESVLAFTLVELLIVIAIIGILAALLFPVLGKARAYAQRTTCLNNLEQINHAIQLYAGENHDLLPMISNTTTDGSTPGESGTNFVLSFYKPLVMNYLGLQGAPSPHDRVFACPADMFYYDDGPPAICYAASLHNQPDSCYSSYAYNGFGQTTLDLTSVPAPHPASPSPGLYGRKLAAITDPAKTVMVAEASAFFPFAWHDSKRPAPGDFAFNNAWSVVSFADGHTRYIPIYFDTNLYVPTCIYNPPAGYDYKWSAN